MALFTPEELDSDILLDLNEEIFELYEASIQNLIELELTPHDNEMQRALFRSVHTIKGDLGLVGFTPMIEVLQYLEDVLDMLRKGEIQYSNPLHDLVVRLLDKVSVFVSDCVKNGQAQYDKSAIDIVSGIIKQLTTDNTAQHESLFKQAIASFNGDSHTSDSEKTDGSRQNTDIPHTGIPKNLSIEKQNDLLFFREIMRSIEKRCGFTEGRGDKIAALAAFVNSFSEDKIDEVQLAVACYVHDFGMAFLPQNIVRKETDLSEMESNLLRSHVYKSTRLLENLQDWDDARKIIMQHHELMDGSGYPLGIKQEDICDGAKLLSIAEAFVNLTTPSLNHNDTVDTVEAIITINKKYKNKFSGKWLRVFNKAMTTHLNAKND